MPTASVATVPHGTPGRAGLWARAREGLKVERVDMTYSALWVGGDRWWWSRGVRTPRDDDVLLGGDRPAEHHGVVLVGQVVAVSDVRTDEVAEAAVQHHVLAGVERGQVLAPDVLGVVRVPVR